MKNKSDKVPFVLNTFHKNLLTFVLEPGQSLFIMRGDGTIMTRSTNDRLIRNMFDIKESESLVVTIAKNES